MDVVLLAGGKGTRLGGLTDERPKPMLEVGGRPLLWHIMSHYANAGFRSFVIATGYKGDVIARWVDDECPSDWDVRAVDTGLDTATAGRVKRLANEIRTDRFMLTWGDGVSSVDLTKLVEFHGSHGRMATVTGVHPPERFGRLSLDGDRVVGFEEKPEQGPGWVNGAFFVLRREVTDMIDGDESSWERDVMPGLVELGELMVYRHDGFWACVDTSRDLERLESMWASGETPWLDEVG